MRILQAGVVALGLSTFSAGAYALPFYEGFDYPAGNLNDAANINPSVNAKWYSSLPSPTTATEDRVLVVSGSLNGSAPLPESVGGMASFGGPGRTDRIAIGGNHTSANTTNIFYSLLMQVTDLTGTAAGGATVFGFNNTVINTDDTTAQPSAITGRIIIKPAPTAGTYFLGASKTGTGGDFVGVGETDPTYNVGDTVFVVGRYTFNTDSSTDDTFSMWINPSPSTFADDNLMPAPNLTATLGGDFVTIATLLLRQTTAIVPAGLLFDEIRVDKSWAGVTPEPSALGLLAMGGAMLLRRSKR
jgi:hypothetical protein